MLCRTGNPRSNPRTNSTFLTVEYSEDGKQWQVVYTDDDWCTRFAWTQPKKALMSESLATITWEIPADAPAGLYRIQHYGSYKLKLLGDVVDFGATSGVFKVVTLQRQG
jgi:neutral ceramidase